MLNEPYDAASTDDIGPRSMICPVEISLYAALYHISLRHMTKFYERCCEHSLVDAQEQIVSVVG
jgi:hypothetical protein